MNGRPAPFSTYQKRMPSRSKPLLCATLTPSCSQHENYESANFWWTDKGQTKETFMVMLDRNIKNSMSISQYETLSLLDPKKYPSLDVGKSPTLQFYKLKIDIPPKANGSFSIFSSWPNDKTYEWVIYEARGRKL